MPRIQPNHPTNLTSETKQPAIQPNQPTINERTNQPTNQLTELPPTQPTN